MSAFLSRATRKLTGRSVNRDRPSVGLALFVEALSEVPDQQISAHLEVGDGPLEVLFALLAEPSQVLEFKGIQPVLDGKLIHDALLAQAGKFLIPAAVKVVAVPPPVGMLLSNFPTLLLRNTANIMIRRTLTQSCTLGIIFTIVKQGEHDVVRKVRR